MVKSTEWSDLEFIAPRSFSSGRPEGPPRLLVVHYTAGSRGPGRAVGGASYDQRRTDGVSAHYYVDSEVTVQCVLTRDRSHTAKYRGNLWGIHYELCGTLSPRGTWLDGIGRPTIRNAARQIARDAHRWGIPLTRIRGAEVRTQSGICGHVDCTVGFPEDRGTHIDPGPDFPWDVLMEDVREFAAEEEDMALSPEDIAKIVDGVHNSTFEKVKGFEWLKLANAVAQIYADQKSLHAKVDALAVSQGIDPEALRRIVDDAIRDDHLRAVEGGAAGGTDG